MHEKFSELKQKEVVNVADGRRLGYVSDLVFDPLTGNIGSFMVPGPTKWCGLIKAEQDYVIPWERIQCIGDDVVLVELDRNFFFRPAGRHN